MRCSEEIPLVKRAAEKYSGQEVTALFIGHQDRVEKLNRYARENKIPGYLFDRDAKVSSSFGITYGAGIVFIDAEGVVKTRIPKGFTPEQLDTGIRKIIKQHA